MGNWRRVHIKGTCEIKDISELHAALNPGWDYENFHCLVCGGICGLPNWAKEDIDVVGNLAERDYDHEDVAEQLKILAGVAPSLTVDVHCGGDYESDTCEHTVRLYAGGKTEILPPQQPEIPELRKSAMDNNFLMQLMGR